MAFPSSSWVMGSSKCLEEAQLKHLIDKRLEYDLSPLQLLLRDAIRKCKTYSTREDLLRHGELLQGSSTILQQLGLDTNDWLNFQDKLAEMMGRYLNDHKVPDDSEWETLTFLCDQAQNKLISLSETQILHSLIATFELLVTLSDTSTREDYAKILGILIAWKKLGFLRRHSSFLVEIDRLATQLHAAVYGTQINTPQRTAIQRSIQNLIEYIAPANLPKEYKVKGT